MANLLRRLLKVAGSGLRAIWLILGIALLLIVLGEAGLRLALKAGDRLARQTPTNHRIAEIQAPPDAHRGATWLRDYSKEYIAFRRRSVWQPYVYWRSPTYRGRYIAMDRDGRRVTWNPPRDLADPPTVRIFAFGGSTMWGTGVRDDHTVASHLNKLLHKRGYPAEVTNYGQIAYVGAQETVALLRCLHRGEIPDIALFYDGVNDVISSYQNDAAGLSQNELRRRPEFGLLDRPRQSLRVLSRQFLEKKLWGFDRFLVRLLLRGRLPPDNGSRARPLRDQVGRRTLDLYASNLAFVESLGRRYGFEPLFYWQPNLFSKRRRSPGEQVRAKRGSFYEQSFDDVYRRVRQSAALNDNPRFHDISTLFDDMAEPYYVDTFHLSEPGNRLVAAAMVDDVIALIERRRAAAAEKAPPGSAGVSSPAVRW